MYLVLLRPAALGPFPLAVYTLKGKDFWENNWSEVPAMYTS